MISTDGSQPGASGSQRSEAVARSACTFKKVDVTRAVEATRAAGIEVARVEVATDGRIIIVAGKPEESAGGVANPWDRK